MLQLTMVNRRYYVSSDWKVGPSTTSTHIVVLVTDGKVLYQFPHKTFHLEAGELLFIPVRTHRSSFPCPPDYHKMYSAHFHVDMASVALPFLHESEPRKVKVNRYEYLRNRFSALNDIWNATDPFYELHSQAILLELLVLINREMELDQHGAKKRQTIRRLNDHIQQHYPDKITLSDLAKLAERSPNYLCHLYKEMTGQTPIEYLNQVRVSAARELLLNSDLNVAEIAERVGFADPYYFSKVYKKVTGLSPKRSPTE